MPVQVFVLGIVQILLSRTLLDREGRRNQALTQEGTWADCLSLDPAGCPQGLGGTRQAEARAKGPLLDVLNWPAAQGRPCPLLCLLEPGI